MQHRGIAQLVEYRSPKPWVAGSNPPAPAKKEAFHALAWNASFFVVCHDEEPRKLPAICRNLRQRSMIEFDLWAQIWVLNPPAPAKEKPRRTAVLRGFFILKNASVPFTVPFTEFATLRSERLTWLSTICSKFY